MATMNDLEGRPTADEMQAGSEDWQVAGQLLLKRARWLAGPTADGPTLSAALKRARREFPALAASESAKITLNQQQLGPGQDLTWQECDEMIERYVREYRALFPTLTEHAAFDLVLAENSWLKRQYARSRG